MYSGLICEDHIFKGILFIYSLLAPIHSLHLVCHSNHVAVPAAVFVGPTKFISKSCNSLAMVLQWSYNCLAMLLTLYCTFSAPKHLLRMSFRSFAVNSSFHCRAASVSERSEANDRGLFEILQYLYIYIYIYMSLSVRILCKDERTLRKLSQHTSLHRNTTAFHC